MFLEAERHQGSAVARARQT